jgi:hypothetical protein
MQQRPADAHVARSNAGRCQVVSITAAALFYGQVVRTPGANQALGCRDLAAISHDR